MAIVRKHRGNWVADYRDQHGKRHRERPTGTFENMALQKIAAQDLLAKRLREVERKDYQPYAERLTFSQVCDRYLEGKVNIRPSTVRSYRGLIDLYLRPYFGHRKVHEITPAHIEDYRAALTAGRPEPVAKAFEARELAANPRLGKARAKQRSRQVKPGVRTINKTLTLLVMIFNYAARHRWVDHNPAQHVEKLRMSRLAGIKPVDGNVLTPAEVNRLIEAAEPPHRDQDGKLISNNYRLLIKTAVFTGMRQGELLGLQWGDVDWNSRQVHVRRAWKDGAYQEPKTVTSTRRIDLPDVMVAELREWRLACPKGPDDLVFGNLDGKPMSHANLLQRGFYPALRRAGLRKIRFHDLRHTCASLLIAAGEDVVRVSRLLGHASPNITLGVYSHMLPKEHYGTAERLAGLILQPASIRTA